MMRWFGILYDRLQTENYDSSNWNARLFLDVTTADGLVLLPGRYNVEIDGVTAWVSGPWELSWSLSEQKGCIVLSSNVRGLEQDPVLPFSLFNDMLNGYSHKTSPRFESCRRCQTAYCQCQDTF
jgi:hypothetical protein